jgi:hypothetical protein
LKIKQEKNDLKSINEQKKLYKENANLFNDYAKIIELKEQEKRYYEEEKHRVIGGYNNLISDIEEQKLKSEYKVDILEKDNRMIFDELVNEIKKK